MSDLSSFVYKEGEKFYFDSENYSEGGTQLSISYEDGDMIKWKWKNKKMTGTIRETGYNLGLFLIENVKIHE